MAMTRPSLLVLLLLSVFPQTTQAEVLWLQEVRHRTGDDPSWASPEFDDQSWKQSEFQSLRGSDSIQWIRTELEISASYLVPERPLALRLAALATCEIYWNGEKLGSNGTVGETRGDEIPGSLDWHLYLPREHLTPGRHLVALRCSTHHRGFRPWMGFYAFLFGDYADLVLEDGDLPAPALVSLSGLLMVGLFYLWMAATERRNPSHLPLACLALAAALLVVAESWRSLVGYTYDFHIQRLRLVLGLAWIVNGLLILFLHRRFPVTGRFPIFPWAIPLLTIPPFFVPGFDGRTMAMFLAGYVLALFHTLRAISQGRRGAWLAALALGAGLVTLLVDPFRFLDQHLFFALDGLLLCLLVAHSLEGRREQRLRKAAELRSARLENELLKRQLQPHFLMNTLTALEEWIEEDPDVAVEMTQALADELRLLGEMSSKPWVELGQEVELCRRHLEVMGRRLDRRYELELEGIDPRDPVPPAIFHTLVENALSHNRYTGPEVRFRLRRTADSQRRCYVFEAPLAENRPAASTAGQGTGLRYVKARLRESCGHDFQLHQGPARGTWRTEICLPEDLPCTSS